MSKRLLTMTLAFAFVLSAPFAAADEKPGTAAKGPRLTVVEPIKDFGTIPKGEKLEWKFEIKNTGTSDLEIISAKPGCGCTVAEFDKLIKPGATGKVTARVDTANFAGPISKGLTIETNDPSTPQAQLTISAIVKPYVEAFPTGLVRFNMLQGDVEKQSVLIYTEEDAPFEIVKIEAPKEWIRAEVRKAEGADIQRVGRAGQNQYVLDVTVGGPEARIGPIAEKIRIVTNSTHQPDFTVSVSGLIRPTYRVEPTAVNFGEVAATDTAATRTVTLRSNSLKTPEDFVVSKAESGVAGLTANVKPTGKKGEFHVTLQVSKDAPAGALDGAVMIHTNDKVNPTTKVTVKGTVKTTVASTDSK